jgi:hypothetical protein
MKFSIIRLALVVAAAVTTLAITASAQLKPNQTYGYGDGQILTFTYTQNFDCIDQPSDDLNFNGIPAESDPSEMQTPICQTSIEPSINPPGVTGDPKSTTDPIFVLVPMFSSNNDQNPADAISCDNVVTGTICGSTLGSTLIGLFGALPEAFKAAPSVYTQCPGPGSAPGTCTMHTSRLDLGPTLVALGYLPPPTSNVFVPTPNHSHVLRNMDSIQIAEWWQVRAVLVLDQSDWPNQDGTSGITTVQDIKAAVAKGTAVQAPSNFFLYFGSVGSADHAHHMNMK